MERRGYIRPALGENASSGDKISLLLELLQGVPQEERTARFVCVVALVWEEGEEIFRGYVKATSPKNPGEVGVLVMTLFLSSPPRERLLPS